MKYKVKRVLFARPRGLIAGTAWMESIKQGGVKSAEYCDQQRMVLLHAPLETIRVPLEVVDELVLGPTLANKPD